MQADGFSLDVEWLQVFSSVQGSFQYSTKAIVSMISTCPLISTSFSAFTYSMGIVPSAQIQLGIKHHFHVPLNNSLSLSLSLSHTHIHTHAHPHTDTDFTCFFFSPSKSLLTVSFYFPLAIYLFPFIIEFFFILLSVCLSVCLSPSLSLSLSLFVSVSA